VDEPEDPLRQQAWAYFALHAQQRLTTLNFYLLLASALTAATVASFQKDFRFPLLRVFAGLLLALLSFVFWRLDLRNRLLIKNAEAALCAYELQGKPDDWRSELSAELLFSNERRNARRRKERQRWWGRFCPNSYSEAFELLFSAFFLTGLLSAISALLL
jgi:hypothetical protein